MMLHVKCQVCGFTKRIAVLTGAVRRSSKRSLIDRCAVSGPVPGSGAKAPESGAGRRQHRDSRRLRRRERQNNQHKTHDTGRLYYKF